MTEISVFPTEIVNPAASQTEWKFRADSKKDGKIDLQHEKQYLLT